MEIRKVFTDLNGTLIRSPYGNPDVAAVRELDEEFPGIFRYAVYHLSDRKSWEDRVLRAFESLEGIPEFKYYDALEKVTEKVKVPKPVKIALDKLSETVDDFIIVSGSSEYALKTIVEKKLKPLLDVDFKLFGTELNVDENGCFKRFVKKIYNFSERAKIVKELKEGEPSVSMGDNKSIVNRGMIEEGDYGVYLADWNKCERRGNVFYIKQRFLPVVIDQILREDTKIKKDEIFVPPLVCKWCDNE